MFTELDIQRVNDCIQEIEGLFMEFPNIFLTEDDLRMHLCSKLLRHFSSLETTEDNDRSIAIHSEVRWYGDGDLHLRSDIVLVEVSTLNVVKYDKMPSKGYWFNFPNGIIELKLRRPIGMQNEVFRAAIDSDIGKLQRLRKVSKHDVPDRKQTQFWMVVLDKSSNLGLGLHESEKAWLNFTYKFASQIPSANS